MDNIHASAEPELAKFDERDVRRHLQTAKFVDKTVGAGSEPFYDSVVIVGAGFTATIMAARLARSDRFHGKVVMAGPRTTESRRLKDGATLRGHGADCISYALGVPQSTFVNALYGDLVDRRGVGTRSLLTMAKRGSSGRYEFGRIAAWQGGNVGHSRALFYGARNSRMQGAMTDLIEPSGLVHVPEAVTTLDEARALALGKRPLIVNASHNSGLLRGGQAPKVDWATVAVQAPMRVRASGLKHIESGAAMVSGVRRGGRMVVGLFNPYGDPLSPESTFYGIMVGEVSARENYDKQREIDVLTEQLLGVADGLGMDADDPDETLFTGLIPGSPWKAPQSAPGTLELQLIAHQGVSATMSDGMTAGAQAALAAAEAVIRGVDPDRAARRAVREITLDRRIWNIQRNRLAAPADFLFRTASEAAAFYPFTVHTNTTWATAG